MIVICDSREKKNEHVKAYFDRNGIEYVVRKLEVGDYMLDDDQTVAVDRKQNLSELATNLMNRNDSARFWREVRRAHDSGIRLIVLCEHGGQIRSINDVPKWNSKYSPVTGRRLIDEMVRCEMAYGVTWLFCDKRSTGRRIVEILTGGK